MAKLTVSMPRILSRLIFLVLISSVISINEQCDENIFILISSKTVFLYDFNSQHENSPGVIYQAKSNTTIENGLFYRRTNTIILLLNHFNETYSLLSLNAYDNIYTYWKEKRNNLMYSSHIYLSLGQRYFYILNSHTMLLQIFSVPLTSTPYKEKYLLNLPQNQQLLNYVVDEKFQYLWILFANNPDQLYICQLTNSSCYLYMNIYNLIKPIQMSINWRYDQFYLYSKNYLIIFEYYQNQTDYSMHYFNSTQSNEERFLTICETTNHVEYISFRHTNEQQVCYQTCQYLPLNATNRIHTIQRLSTLSSILHCSKQRQISKIIILILILVDLAVLLGFIIWLAYKYFYQTIFDKHGKGRSSGTIWTIEKDFITHF